jgi:hypothetical protein
MLGGPPRHGILILGREPEHEAAPGAMVGMVVGAEFAIGFVAGPGDHDLERLGPVHHGVSVKVNCETRPQYQREPFPAARVPEALKGLAEVTVRGTLTSPSVLAES